MVCSALATHWAAMGQDVTVFADSRIGSADAERDFDKSCPWPVHRFSGPGPLRRWRKSHRIAGCTADKSIRALYADSWKSVPLSSHIQAPVLCLAYGNDLLTDSEQHRRRRAYARATFIIANSDYTADLVRRDVPDPKRVRVIPPGISPLPEPSAITADEISRAIGDRTPVLASIARLEPRKGIDMVIRSLSLLRHKYPRIVYLIIGSGDDRKRLENIAVEYKVMSRVYFFGQVPAEKKSALLRAADLLVMPGRRVGNAAEGFGIAFLEAAMGGTPSVGGCTGGAIDAIGQTGWLCDGSNQNEVTTTLITALSDRDELAQRSAAAKQRAAALFNWESVAGRHLALIDETRQHAPA